MTVRATADAHAGRMMSSYPNENSAIGGGDGDGGGGGGGDASVPEENSVEYMNGASVTSMSLWPGWAFTLVVMKSSGMIEARNMASLCGLCLRTRAMAHQHGSGAGHDDVCDECMGACTQQVSVVFAFENGWLLLDHWSATQLYR